FYPEAEFLYTGMAHRANQTFEDSLFDGDENAIVDFKYSNNEKLTWWFDHHQSAFLSPEDAQHFKTHPSPKKMFDISFKSCTKYIRTKAQQLWGFTAPDLDDLVHWANIIDGAQYADPKTAVELGAPAMKLTLVIEGSKGSDMVQQIIRYMQHIPLAEIVEKPEIQEIYKPLYERHLRSLQIIRDNADETGGVITFDLTGYDLEGYNKFIPYYLYPSGIYTVAVSPSTFRTKISVGSNPWAPVEPAHNLATICERYGGGGHARVGAISLEPGQVDEARRIAAEVAAELRS
ncbi:MAG: hypothetical protein QOJ99_1689, partial [Bryobacterales bacterium]|nr:hypothetical protein [Bryobacterales bacterium]